MAEWTRQQLLVALHLYCEIPFGKIHHRNPQIVEYAEKLGRTPSALALKLTNIASLDPAITSTGRSGMRNASAADREMWDEMTGDWEGFATEAQHALRELRIQSHPIPDAVDESESNQDYTSMDATAQAKVRIGQQFFRRSVLSAYDFRCCITGLTLPSLLVASHIVPWREDPSNRLNPQNGLCLSVLHDRAFDSGIITIDPDMTVIVSNRYEATDDEFFRNSLLAYQGKPISLPQKFPPDPHFLAYHREQVFMR